MAVKKMKTLRFRKLLGVILLPDLCEVVNRTVIDAFCLQIRFFPSEC